MRIQGNALWLATIMTVAGCRPAANDAERVQPAIEALLVLDLSPSLSREQRLQSTGIAMQIIRHELPPLSSFAVYALESNMLDATTLLAGDVPDPVTTTDVVNAAAQFQRWETELATRVRAVLDDPPQAKNMTSCYVKSLTFASAYFDAKPQRPRLLAWIGDLIEDCREVSYAGFRLSRVGAQPDALPARYAWPRLTHTTAWAVIVPRSTGERAREVDIETIGGYWRNVAARLSIGAEGLRVGTPTLLGIAGTR